MSNNDVASALAEIIADEIGDRLYHNPTEIGEVTDWHQSANATAFHLADGRIALVTVVVDGGAA